MFIVKIVAFVLMLAGMLVGLSFLNAAHPSIQHTAFVAGTTAISWMNVAFVSGLLFVGYTVKKI